MTINSLIFTIDGQHYFEEQEVMDEFFGDAYDEANISSLTDSELEDVMNSESYQTTTQEQHGAPQRYQQGDIHPLALRAQSDCDIPM